MTRIDRTDMIADILEAQGLTEAHQNIKLYEDRYSDAQGNVRATIEIGYTNENGKFKSVYDCNTWSIEQAIKNLNNRQEIATSIDMAVRAMPADSRPNLPQWVSEISKAQRIEENMNKARSISSKAEAAQKVEA